MEAKLLKSPNSSHDLLLIRLDDQSLSYLNNGSPIRVAFFMDNNEDLPWYKRKCMVAMIGKDLDFDKYKADPGEVFKNGMVDKGYLVDYINRMKKKLFQVAMEELGAFDVPLQIPGHSQINPGDIINIEKAEQEDIPISLEEIQEKPKECLSAPQVLEMLNISRAVLYKFIRQKKIKAEFSTLLGWSFIRSDIEKVLEEKPEFLTKIWNNPCSIKNRENSQRNLVYDNEEYIHIKRVETVLNLSDTTIKKYIKLGFIKYKKDPHKEYYVSKNHLNELKANPPDWLRKSWINSGNNKEETVRWKK
ncbi:MAG TPA: hypothetical protein DCY56_06855 [Candidatus Omnitrophica bacterium]|nr:hypothetical protein [Candidatus Omnitrophota bacterium]